MLLLRSLFSCSSIAQPQYHGQSRRSEWDVCINADAEVGVGVDVGEYFHRNAQLQATYDGETIDQ